MKGIITSLLIVFFLMASVQASFIKGNLSHRIVSSYGPGGLLQGMINISFINETTDSNLSSSLGGSIRLENFINLNSVNKQCFPYNCQNDYTVSGESTSKSFSLASGAKKLVGFSINGQIDPNGMHVTKIEFTLNSSAGKSCSIPLKLDFLNNGDDWQFLESSNDFSCSKSYGCYVPDESADEVYIGTRVYCERIAIEPAPAVEIGAWVRKGTTANPVISMSLYSQQGSELASCDLSISAASGEFKCIPDYAINTAGYYYSCISADTATDYSIRKKASSQPCGIFGVPSTGASFTTDYSLFMTAAKFNVTEKINFTLESDDTILGSINTYLESRYGHNCNDGCAIPIKITSGIDQTILINNVELFYNTVEGAMSTNKIYDIESKPAKLSTGMGVLDLSFGNFTVPSTYGNYTLSLLLGDSSIFTEMISVQQIPVIASLTPLNPPAATEVEFSISASSPRNYNLTNYTINFGDGTVLSSTRNKIIYAYAAPGTYQVTVSVKDSGGLTGTRAFSVVAGNPQQAANYTLDLYGRRLANITSIINSMPDWQEAIVLENFNLSDYEIELAGIAAIYSLGSYTEAMTALTNLDAPLYIKEAEKIEKPLVIQKENINPSYLGGLGITSYDSSKESRYKNDISAWMLENVDAKITYTLYSIEYKRAGMSPVAAVYNIDVNRLDNENNKNIWFVIGKNKDRLSFASDYSERDLKDGAATGISMNEAQDIQFATHFPLSEVFIYISPELSYLPSSVNVSVCNLDGKCGQGETWKNCRADCKPWGLAGILIGIVIFLSILAYLFLGWWYEKKYENSLFKNKSDLFNLVSFTNNAYNQGMNDSQVVKLLRDSGWNSEQINYALKKVKGKHTGMPGIHMRKLQSEYKKA